MIVTINRSPSWGSMPVGAVVNLPSSLADPLIASGEAVPTPNATPSVGDPFGGSSGSQVGYLGPAANQAEMTALPAAVGDECTRTDLGTGGLRYELAALPNSTVGNWQALQGTLAAGSLVTIALIDGKLPRRLLVSVANGCLVTVAIGGVTQPVLPETVSGQYHEILISDDPAASQPTTLTLLAAGASTSTYSLES